MSGDTVNVLVVSREFSNVSGGGAVYISNLVKRIKKHKFHVVTYVSRPDIKKHMLKAGHVTIWHPSLPTKRYVNALTYVTYSVVHSIRQDFDFIIGSDMIGSLSAFIIHKVTGKPYMSIVQNVIYSDNVEMRKILYSRVLSSASAIIVTGPKLKKDIQTVYGHIFDHKIHLIPPGVEIPKHIPKIKKPKKPVLLFVGLIYNLKKGVQDVIKAMSIITKDIDCEFWVVGGVVNKEAYEKLIELVKKSGLDKNVKFFGIVDNVFSYYDACDIFVHPSHLESFGIPCIEVSAMGKPIVATDVLLENGVVTKKTALIVPKKSPKKIAAGVLKLLKSKGLQKRLGRNGIEHSKKYRWDESARKMEMLIR